MSIKVLINGFGRMGRLFLRDSFDNKKFDLVAMNELRGCAVTAALCTTIHEIGYINRMAYFYTKIALSI